MDLPETVSFAAAARLLDLPRSTLDRRLRDGTIPFRQLGRGCARRVFVSELIRLGVSKLAIDAVLHLTGEHGEREK